jgi:hypothetical protein
MNISDLNHLEVISEESITDLIGAGTVSLLPSLLITGEGPLEVSLNVTTQIQGLSTPTSSFGGFSIVGSLLTF